MDLQYRGECTVCHHESFIFNNINRLPKYSYRLRNVWNLACGYTLIVMAGIKPELPLRAGAQGMKPKMQDN